MKIEIYGEPKEKEEKVIMLRLIMRDEKSVFLSAVDESGNDLPCGKLFLFNSDGSCFACGDVNPDIGIQLSTNGTVLVQ